MKRILLLSLLCVFGALALQAAPAALMERYVYQTGEQAGERWFMTQKIMNGETINVEVNAPHHSEQQQAYEQYVQKLYDKWFNDLEDILREADREEFDDLLKQLPQQVSINFVNNDEDTDVRVLFLLSQEVAENCDGNKYGCVTLEEGLSARVSLVDDVDFKHGKINGTHLHEIGHTLGLADQYYSGRNKNASPAYAGPVRAGSVMEDNPDYVKRITLDDADGLVLAIDLAMGNYNRGGEKGWKSLNKKSNQYYIHGKVANSPHSFSFDVVDDSPYVYFIQYAADGKPEKKQQLVFDKNGWDVFDNPPLTQVLKRDALNRPIIGTGPNAETVYISYHYESISELVLKENKVLLYEKKTFEKGSNKRVAKKRVVAGAGEKGCIILDGDFGGYGSKKLVRYGLFEWTHGLGVYTAQCNKSSCEATYGTFPEDLDPRSKELAQRVFFEKLNAWFSGKGTLKAK